jgi:hypothetical protein
MTDRDLLDRRLADALDTAQHDPRWSGHDWTDPLGRVRSGARRSRRRVALASAAAVAVVATGGVMAGAALTSHDDHLATIQPLDGGPPGDTGARWLLPLPDYWNYEAAHPQPSPFYEKVPSPAPVDDDLRQLRSDLSAVIPGDFTILRADAADGGAKGLLNVELELADGTHVEASRRLLDYPRPLAAYTGHDEPDPGFADEHFTDPEVLATGSAYTVVTGTSVGYSPVDGADGWFGPYVELVTADGWDTSITAPVAKGTLVDWATAMDAHFASTR